MEQTIKNYRVKEVAKMLGVCEATVWNYIGQGRLKTVKLSPRVTIVRHSELNRFMNEETE